MLVLAQLALISQLQLANLHPLMSTAWRHCCKERYGKGDEPMVRAATAHSSEWYCTCQFTSAQSRSARVQLQPVYITITGYIRFCMGRVWGRKRSLKLNGCKDASQNLTRRHDADVKYILNTLAPVKHTALDC